MELDPVADDFGTNIANVFLVVYNRFGAMVSLDSWEIMLSNMNTTPFSEKIRIPRQIDVGSIKLIVASDRMLPIMLPTALT